MANHLDLRPIFRSLWLRVALENHIPVWFGFESLKFLSDVYLFISGILATASGLCSWKLPSNDQSSLLSSHWLWFWIISKQYTWTYTQSSAIHKLLFTSMPKHCQYLGVKHEEGCWNAVPGVLSREIAGFLDDFRIGLGYPFHWVAFQRACISKTTCVWPANCFHKLLTLQIQTSTVPQHLQQHIWYQIWITKNSQNIALYLSRVYSFSCLKQSPQMWPSDFSTLQVEDEWTKPKGALIQIKQLPAGITR